MTRRSNKKIDLTIWKMDQIAPGEVRSQIEAFILKTIASGNVSLLPSQRVFAKLNHLNPSIVKRAYLNLTHRGSLISKKASHTMASDHRENQKTGYVQSPFNNELPRPLPEFDVSSLGPPALEYDFRPIGLDRLNEYYQPKAMNKYLRFHRKRYRNITQMNHILESSNTDYRDAIRDYVNIQSKLRLDEGCLAISMGREECLRRIFRVLLAPGDQVINTAPMDVLLRNVLYRQPVATVNMHTGEEDFLKKLEAYLNENTIKVMYINSQCAFPEGHHLDTHTCEELVRLAKKHGFYIIEENDLYEFWYPTEDFKPLARHDHQGQVIYTAPLSQSSIYMYNTRIIAAVANFISILESIPARPYELRNIIEELSIINIMKSGELSAHVDAIKQAKMADRDQLYMELDNYLGPWIDTPKPDSGLSFWIAFPPEVDINKAMGYLNNNAIDIPYNPFVPQIRNKVYRMRITYSTFNILEAQKAAKLLHKMFEEHGIRKIR